MHGNSTINTDVVFHDLFYSANFSAWFKIIVKNSHFMAHTWIDYVFHVTPYDCLLHGSEYPKLPDECYSCWSIDIRANTCRVKNRYLSVHDINTGSSYIIHGGRRKAMRRIQDISELSFLKKE